MLFQFLYSGFSQVVSLPDCAFIDYGNMIFGKALMDVAFFLSTNFHPDFRRAHEHELLSFYHRCLVAGGIEEASFSFEQCWLDYRWQTLHIFLTFALFTSRTFEKQRRAGTGPYAPPTRRTGQRRRRRANGRGWWTQRRAARREAGPASPQRDLCP